jgi:NAD(P)-dependent dehydrogenase (short-subunit alcohol dehydrogenase family)
MAQWTSQDIPSLSGKTFVVTGANSGLGLETTRQLHAHGATVVMACRDVNRAQVVAQGLAEEQPGAPLEVLALDLTSLASVRAFAQAVLTRWPALDGLINNAGVMATSLAHTADGFELQFGTNHLGHFALTGLLLPALEQASAPRVVSVSSMAHRLGRIRFDDLQSARRYERWAAYGQSKLANLLFTFELERKLRHAGKKLQALVAHPGYSATSLQTKAAKEEQAAFTEQVMTLGNLLLAQSAADGALPTLCAATNPQAKGGQFWGPDGFFELSGTPKVVEPNAAAQDEAVADRLWSVSEELTRVAFGL